MFTNVLLRSNNFHVDSRYVKRSLWNNDRTGNFSKLVKQLSSPRSTTINNKDAKTQKSWRLICLIRFYAQNRVFDNFIVLHRSRRFRAILNSQVPPKTRHCYVSNRGSYFALSLMRKNNRRRCRRGTSCRGARAFRSASPQVSVIRWHFHAPSRVTRSALPVRSQRASQSGIGRVSTSRAKVIRVSHEW